MSDRFIDTNVVIRYLTGDDPIKERESAALFKAVKEGTLRVVVPLAVIYETTYVLASSNVYRFPRSEVAAMLMPLLQLTNLRIDNRDLVLRTLEIFGSVNIDFADAMIVASMEAAGATELYSYDADFDRFSDIVRNPDILT